MLDNGHIPVGVPPPPPLFDLACCRTIYSLNIFWVLGLRKFDPSIVFRPFIGGKQLHGKEPG